MTQFTIYRRANKVWMRWLDGKGNWNHRILSDWNRDIERARREMETTQHWYPCDFRDHFLYYAETGEAFEGEENEELKEAVTEYIDEVYRAVRVSQLLNR